ncbi:hypothetical protein MRB53_019930 [Persea americana]|uniref:Uncharacterized protein n=1 Tax=Persea americana TaxID=3435 RepID=A0ACC2L0R8_PERAE|nr:hypothetical protein MRB53_019930 [Persea americana]
MEHFGDFYEEWMRKHEENLQQLLSVPRDSTHEPQQRAMVARAIGHITHYYAIKRAAAHASVLALFSPTWLTSFEIACLWMTGWKPSLAFRLVDTLRRVVAPGMGLGGLSDAQLRRIEQMQAVTRTEEEKVEMEMERQQMALAGRRMVELSQITARARDGEVVEGMVEVALEGVMKGLEKVVVSADCVRLKALKRVVEGLSPLQSVDYMAALLMLQIQIRNFGKGRNNLKTCQ